MYTKMEIGVKQEIYAYFVLMNSARFIKYNESDPEKDNNKK